MTIINFYGAPGGGKSTLALGFTSYLKSKGLNAEYVGEYIKNLIAYHGDDHTPIFNQLDILVNQNKLLESFFNNSDYVVTDSPLLNTLVYLKYNKDPQIEYCKNYISALCLKLNNYYRFQYNILVLPCQDPKKYKDSLRNYDFKQSLEISKEFKKLPINYDKEIYSFNEDPLNIYDQLYKNIL